MERPRVSHDYLTVQADEIKNIKPALTMVGGRVVYDAATEPPSPKASASPAVAKRAGGPSTR